MTVLHGLACRTARACTAAAALLFTTGTALAGPDWTEVGDAGSFFGSAQITSGTSANLTTIYGSLSAGFGAGDYEDMYIIRIIDPANFSMRIDTTDFNAQLFLFNITLPLGAYGLLSNDDRSASDTRPLLGNMATDATGAKVALPGDYAIAVSGFNNDPLSSTGLIFGPATTFEVSGADGPGGLNHHIAWTGSGETGSYTITLTGAGFPEIPAPGAAALLVLSAGGLAARRRR
jgi:hypothetical protein